MAKSKERLSKTFAISIFEASFVMKTLKEKLYNACVEYVNSRLKMIQSEINAVNESAGSETKSSAGDKHETGRAMLQLEQEKNARKLSEIIEMQESLLKLNVSSNNPTVSPGSIVITKQGNFFISIAAGKLEIDGVIYFAISSQSPLGNLFLMRKKGEEINFNERSYFISEVH